MTFDRDGNLVVTNIIGSGANQDTQVYLVSSEDGSILRTITSSVLNSLAAPSEDYPLSLPSSVKLEGIAIDPENGEIVATNSAGSFSQFIRVGDDDAGIDSVLVQDIASDATDIESLAFVSVQVASGESSVPATNTTPVNFDRLVDVTAGFDIEYEVTSLNDGTDILYANLTLTNKGVFDVRDTLLIGATNFDQPVELFEPDGITPDGLSFFNVSTQAFLPGQIFSQSGDIVNGIELRFLNPKEGQFDFDLVILGALNEAPAFTNDPLFTDDGTRTIEIKQGNTFTYDAKGLDPEGDEFDFSFILQPGGIDFFVDATTTEKDGVIQWDTSGVPLGRYDVTLRVTDEYDAFDINNDKSFTVIVENGANRAPYFIDPPPIVDAYVGQEYRFDAEAFDPDYDNPLTYSLAGITHQRLLDGIGIDVSFDVNTSELVWTPTADDLNAIYLVEMFVSDGDLTGNLPYSIKVHPDPTNHDPIITEFPEENFILPSPGTPGSANVTPQNGFELSLYEGQTHTETITITLDYDQGTAANVDVFLLFDDTGSFSGQGDDLALAFSPTEPDNIIDALIDAFPETTFGFGVGVFEDYSTEGPDNRPFVLNQPIITLDAEDSGVDFDVAITSALTRDIPGGGVDLPESLIEALFQVALGLGFDGNDDGDTSDSGLAGLASTQISPGFSGDVPAFSSFTKDLPNNVLLPSGSLGGVGFRNGALPIILVATDIGTVYEPDNPIMDLIVGVESVPLVEFDGPGSVSRTSTPGGRGATIQETVNALVNLGALVVGIGDAQFIGETDPQSLLSALAKATGARNQTTQSFNSGLADDLSTVGDDESLVEPGDPLYFELNGNGPIPLDIADAVSAAIESAVLSSTFPVEILSSDPTFISSTVVGVVENANDFSVTFEVTFTGDGMAHSYDLQFVPEGTSIEVGTLPVEIGVPYRYDAEAIDPDPDDVVFFEIDVPVGVAAEDYSFDSQTGEFEWSPQATGTYDFEIRALDGRGGQDDHQWAVTVGTSSGANQAPTITPIDTLTAEVSTPFSFSVDAQDPDITAGLVDRLQYFLTDIVGGTGNPLQINRYTGELTWTPDATQATDALPPHSATVKVVDAFGASATEDFFLEVNTADFDNQAPQFDESVLPSSTITFEDMSGYEYDAVATDPDMDELFFDLPLAPVGMAIDEKTGIIRWFPEEAEIGSHTIIARVRDREDGSGKTDLLVFNVDVLQPNELPLFLTQADLGTIFTGAPAEFEYVIPIQAFDPFNPVTIPAGTF